MSDAKLKKAFFDVDVALRRNFQERNPEFVGQLLTALGGNDSLFFPIAFVTYQDLLDSFGGMLLHIGEPRSNV